MPAPVSSTAAIPSRAPSCSPAVDPPPVCTPPVGIARICETEMSDDAATALSGPHSAGAVPTSARGLFVSGSLTSRELGLVSDAFGSSRRVQPVDDDDSGAGLDRLERGLVEREGAPVGVGATARGDGQVRRSRSSGRTGRRERRTDRAVGRHPLGGADDAVLVRVGACGRADALTSDVDVLDVCEGLPGECRGDPQCFEGRRVGGELVGEPGDLLAHRRLVTFDLDGDLTGRGPVRRVQRDRPEVGGVGGAR